MALYEIIVIVATALGIFLNGINKLKFQVVIGLLQAGAAFVLKIVMAKAFGISGVIWASVIMAYLGTGVVFLYVRRLLVQMDALRVR
jgi:hypothetical protein